MYTFTGNTDILFVKIKDIYMKIMYNYNNMNVNQFYWCFAETWRLPLCEAELCLSW